jgi:hypothetical protein
MAGSGASSAFVSSRLAKENRCAVFSGRNCSAEQGRRAAHARQDESARKRIIISIKLYKLFFL